MKSNNCINEQELVRLLKKIEAIPCVLPEDIEQGVFYDLNRVNVIDNEVKGSSKNYRWINGHNYYRLYAQDTLDNLHKECSHLILVSSHADNIQTSSSYAEDSHPGFLKGCFDNASTNAVCVYLMKYVELPRNVLFVFTADEEYDSEGAEHAASKIKHVFGKGYADVIVLDVTCGWHDGADFTIENDLIYKKHDGDNFIKRVCEIANKTNYKWSFIKASKDEKSDTNDIEKFVPSNEIEAYMDKERVTVSQYPDGEGIDESYDYAGKGFSAFSLCLPCSAKDEKEMHGKDGFEISKETLCHYTDFLAQLLQSWQSIKGS